MDFTEFNGEAVERVLESRKVMLDRLKGLLDPSELDEASRDGHSRREPLPCGITIHTGVGCSFGCLYCYIYDMGFTSAVKPYPLNGLQLAYALLLNPYFIPGAYGTLLAFGSVTEPFARNTVGRTMEYMKTLRDILGNPQQASTKSTLSDNEISLLREAADPSIDILVTVTTLKHWRILEPGAPSPIERLDFASRLIARGLHVTLFMRPIIPGITDREATSILEEAWSRGVRDVVLGTLRVTPSIMRRLEASRVVDVNEITRRLGKPLTNPRVQVPIVERDLKEKVAREAERLGFNVHPSSCSSNIASHRQACAACPLGPCGDVEKLPVVDEKGVLEASRALGMRVDHVEIHGYRVIVRCRDTWRKCRILKHYIISLARRTPVFK